MSTITKDLGVVTAYGYYKAGGGTMTEAEFTQFMVDFGAASKTAVDAAEAALESERAAKESEETATRKATEAGESASTASTKAGEAAKSASDADTAKNDAVSAKNAAEIAQGKAEDAQAATESVAESIPSDYSQLSEDVTKLKSGFSEVKEELNDAINVISEDKIELQQWERGNINNSTGANANSDRFVRTSNYYDVTNINGMTCILDSGNCNDLIFTVYKYGSSSNYLGYVSHAGGTFDIDLAGVSTVRFLLETTSGDSTTVIDPADSNDLLTVTASVFVKVATSDDFMHDNPIKLDWERGKIGSTGNNSASSSTTHIRTEFRHFIPKGKFRLTIPTGVSVTVFRYTAVTGSTFDRTIGTYVASTDILITANSYIRLMAYYTSGSDTPLSVGDAIIVSYTETFNEIAEKSNDDELSDFCSLAMFSDIAVLGDSYASGSLHMPNNTFVQNYALSWGQILARRIGATVTNFSDGGLSTKTWLTNATYGLSALLADTAKQLYIINFGINDNTQIAAGTLALGSLSDINLTDYTQNPDSFYGNYGRIIGNIKTHAPKALIITLSVARPNERNMDEHIKQVADKCGVPFIQLTDDDYFTSGYFYGSINAGHPLAYGYSGMATAIQRLIQHYIVSNPSYFYNYDGLTA